MMKMYLAVMSLILCCCVTHNCDASVGLDKDKVCTKDEDCKSLKCNEINGEKKCGDGTKAYAAECNWNEECETQNCGPNLQGCTVCMKQCQ